MTEHRIDTIFALLEMYKLKTKNAFSHQKKKKKEKREKISKILILPRLHITGI